MKSCPLQDDRRILLDHSLFDDDAIVPENMWLMADSPGLGGVWPGIAPEEDRKRMVKEALELPDDVEAFALLPVGYPAESRPQQDRFDEKRIHRMD